MFDLSIILPTCNRAALLERALASIAGGTRCACEIVVVDGASTDHTQEVLAHASSELGDRLRVIREDRREGFVRAANKGFRAARGRNLTWLNDDARPLPGALDAATRQVDLFGDDLGLVALFHRWHSTWNVAYEAHYRGRVYRLCHVRGTLYANFALGRRDTFERLGYFDERFFVCGADPDLSLKAWHAGLRIIPAAGAMIDHDEVQDDRRTADSSRAEEDNRRLFAKWNLPARNPHYNEFDPLRPCTVRGLHTEAVAA
jgi:GT2 family glycosyltransferase